MKSFTFVFFRFMALAMATSFYLKPAFTDPDWRYYTTEEIWGYIGRVLINPNYLILYLAPAIGLWFGASYIANWVDRIFSNDADPLGIKDAIHRK